METEELKDKIFENLNDNKITFMTIEGMATADLEKFCKQDADGMLYDLNRDDATILTLAEKSKNQRWVNDYALVQLFKYVNDERVKLQKENAALKNKIEVLKIENTITNKEDIECPKTINEIVRPKRMGDDLVCNINLL